MAGVELTGYGQAAKMFSKPLWAQPVKSSPSTYNTLLSLKLNPCLMFYAGVSIEADLPKVDYAKAFSNYLLSHGMTSQELEALVQALTEE